MPIDLRIERRKTLKSKLGKDIYNDPCAELKTRGYQIGRKNKYPCSSLFVCHAFACHDFFTRNNYQNHLVPRGNEKTSYNISFTVAENENAVSNDTFNLTSVAA